MSQKKMIGSHGDWPKPSNLFRPATSCTCTTGPPTQQRWETQSDLSKGRVIPNYRIRMYVLTRPKISPYYNFSENLKGQKMFVDHHLPC
jgi:hypothetical protein